jgi:hypothetical protein
MLKKEEKKENINAKQTKRRPPKSALVLLYIEPPRLVIPLLRKECQF